jgi:hypothetical protein
MKLTADFMLIPAQSMPKPIPRGLYAARPGTGPEGETCGSCKHIFHNRLAKTYLKCSLMRGKWTGGGGTDIKSRAPACSKWEKPEE